MSNVVGSLVVNLAAHTTEFTSGLKKATDATRQMSREALAMEIFRGQSGQATSIKDVADSFRSASDEAGSAIAPLSNVHRLLQNIAKVGVGGRAFRLATNFGAAATEVTGISGAMLGVGAAAGAATLLSKRFGDEILATRREAVLTGKAFADLASEKGMTTFSEAATYGLESVSVMAESVWKGIKRVTGEVLGWLSLPFAAVRQTIESIAGVNLGTQSQQLQRQQQQEAEYSKKFSSALKEVDGIFASINDKAGSLGKTELQLVLEKAEKVRKAMGGVAFDNAFGAKAEELKKNYELIQGSNAQDALKDARKALSSIGRDVTPEQQILDGLSESLTKLGVGGQKAQEIMAQANAEGILAKERREGLEATKKAAQEQENLRNRLKALTETPISRFAEVANDLARGFQAGMISAEAYSIALAKARQTTVSSLMSDVRSSGGAPPALAYGSRELANMIADKSQGPSSELQEAKRQTRKLEQIYARMPDIAVGGL